MTEKRYFKIGMDYDGVFFFDKKQEYVDEPLIKITKAYDLVPMSDEQVVDLLNENEQLKKENKALTIGENETILKQEATLTNLLNENKELKKLCKTLIGEIEKKSIAFIIDEDVRGMLE